MDLYQALTVERDIETFAAELLDDDRLSFGFAEADALARELRVTTAKVIRDLQDYGFAYEGRRAAPRVRGFTSSSNDRWFGPGSSPTHGGGGGEQIAGFAGRAAR